MKKIGSVHGKSVFYCKSNNTVWVYGTDVRIFNVKSEEEAVRAAERNFISNFRHVGQQA